METAINSIGKFKEYKERKVRELIQKHCYFCGMTWQRITTICVLLLCFTCIMMPCLRNKDILSYCTTSHSTKYLQYLVLYIKTSNSYHIHIGLCAIIFLTIIGYKAYQRSKDSLYIQNTIYDCLDKFSNYEKYMTEKIEYEILKKQIQDNDKEIWKLKYLVKNIKLKNNSIDGLIKSNYHKPTIPSMGPEHYIKMVEKKETLEFEKCRNQQLTNKYIVSEKLLKSENSRLKNRKKTSKYKAYSRKLILIDINECIKSTNNDNPHYENLKNEIRILFIDLIDVVSNIKIL